MRNGSKIINETILYSLFVVRFNYSLIYKCKDGNKKKNLFLKNRFTL